MLTGLDRGEPGTYVLVMRLPAPASAVIGARGAFELDAGYYLYVGGALNGLVGRLERHLRAGAKKLYWHIDYLRAQTELVEIWWTVSPERLECAWGAALREWPQVTEPIPRFGAGDCNCSSHLFYLPDKPAFDRFASLWLPNTIHRSLISNT